MAAAPTHPGATPSPEQRRPKQEQQPAEDEVRELAPEVLRIQLPIDMPGLGHVNTYVLADDQGVTVVDPGVPGQASWQVLVSRLGQAGLRVGDVHTVVVTHSHPDHFGGAGRLAAEAEAVLVTQQDFRTWWSRSRPDPCDSPDDGEGTAIEGEIPGNPWEGRTPWGGESLSSGWRRRMAEGDMADWRPPEPDRGVADGEMLALAGREWACLHTPGHTLDHLCLHDPEGGILLSGDHVLPTITPHISGIGAGPDPLAAFLASLDRVAALEGVTLVLPAHGQPFTDLAGRVEAIKGHHAERLDRLRRVGATLGAASVADFSHELFRPARWGPMAESETYAHLEHLRLAGLAEAHEEGGLLCYELEPLGP